MATQISNLLVEKYGKVALTAEQAAEIFGVEVEDVEMMLQSGELQGKRLGTQVRISVYEIEKILSGNFEKAIDTALIPALSFQPLNFEEFIVSEEEYQMGRIQSGSVYFNQTRQKWQAAYYVEDVGLKKRKIITGGSEWDVTNAMRQALGLAGMVPGILPAVPIQKHLVGDYLQSIMSAYFNVDVTNTTRQYYSDVSKYIVNGLNGVYIEDLGQREIQAFLTGLKRKDGKKVSPRVQKAVKGMMSKMFLYAVDEDILRKNPMGVGIKIEKINRQKSKTKKINMDVLEKIMIAAKKSKTYYPIVNTLLGTGMRIGELIALRYENVDFEKGCIFIQEAAKRVYEGQEAEGEVSKNVGDPKTAASFRVIPIHKSLLDMLAAMRKQNPKAELVFPNKDGNMRAYSGLRRQMDRFWVENGLGEEKITFHRFRHSYSTCMGSAGVATVVIASLMGHLNDNVTDDVYQDVEDPRKYEAVRKYYKYMEGVLTPSKRAGALTESLTLAGCEKRACQEKSVVL